jgi:hypothetical protein
MVLQGGMVAVRVYAVGVAEGRCRYRHLTPTGWYTVALSRYQLEIGSMFSLSVLAVSFVSYVCVTEVAGNDDHPLAASHRSVYVVVGHDIEVRCDRTLCSVT